MEKLPHFLTSLVFHDAIYTSLIAFGGSLASYYVYKQILPLFSSGCNKQMWKKIPFIQKKVENEIQKMKEN